jgi:virulence-associated protein VapD
MNNFTKTFIIGSMITLGTTTNAMANDDTFKVAFTYDNTISIEENYNSLQEQAHVACQKEARRAGFRKTESSTWLRRQCEKEILTKVIKSTNNPLLTLVHNETWGIKTTVRSYAQNK